MEKIRKLHFINRIDYNNVGDWWCSPLFYYYDFFKDYTIIRHDIDYINYSEIEKEDVVILGGSGLFHVTESFDVAINHILDICDTVIGWSCGFNTHNEQWYQGNSFPEIDFSRFSLIGIRDYNHPSGIEYLPCPSSLVFEEYVQKNIDYDIKREIGYIGHKDLIYNDCLFKTISNNESIYRIADYILSSEIIVTRSYHCAYWALLLGKKVIVLNKFSNKFDYFKYPPQFLEIDINDSIENIRKRINNEAKKAKTYVGLYEEAKTLNQEFFDKVKRVILDRNITKGRNYQEVYTMGCLQAWNRLSITEKNERNICGLRDDVYNQLEQLKNQNAIYKKEIDELREIYNSTFTCKIRKGCDKLKQGILKTRN